MNPWYENMLREQYERHDSMCVDGAACTIRERHVKGTYMPQALSHRVEELNIQVQRRNVMLADLAAEFDANGNSNDDPGEVAAWHRAADRVRESIQRLVDAP